MINPSQDSVGSLVPCRRRVFSESDESNRVLASLLTDQSIATLFEARVAAHPQKIALQTHEREFTYSEINEAANGLASGLLEHVGGRSGPVAIWLEDGFAVAASLLATWKAGKAFLAGNLQAPDAYNRTIFSVAAPVVIVAEERFRVQVEQLVPPDTVVLIWEEIRANPSAENPNIVVPPEALLRIVFTSGSTGVPKGIEHDQQGMLREAHAAMAGAYYRSDDRFLQLSSLSHVNGSDWLFYVFMMGATLSCYPLRLWGVEALEQWVAEKQITRFVAVPTVFRHFVRLSQVTRQSLASVLIVHLGGEPVRPDDVRRFKALFPAGAKLIANIGSTEAGSFARCIFNQDTPIPEKSLPLGRAHPGIVIQLWDEFENRVSDGSTGEIVVGSRGVARGYFQQHDLTARVFRQDASAPRLRWFKTGDLAWYDGDGILHSAGRKDRQVKIRGHRVELPEIEAVIADHPMIDNVVVKAWLDESQGTRLVAYYSSSGSVVVTGSTLLSWLHPRLPNYMIPAHFRRMTDWPILASGKVDRENLVDPRLSPQPMVEEETMEEGEQKLIKIWCAVFALEMVRPSDNFFSLGGDSLHATSLLAAIETEFGKRLTASVLLEAPSLRALGKCIESASSMPGNFVKMRPGDGDTVLVFVHGWGGTITHYLKLVSCLSFKGPVVGLQGSEQQGDPPTFRTVPELARHYTNLIRKMYPKKKYILAGHSAGGVLAYTIAVEFAARARSVDLVIAIDSRPNGIPIGQRGAAMLPYLKSRWRVHGQRLRKLPLRHWIHYAWHRFRASLHLARVVAEPVKSGQDYYIDLLRRHRLPQSSIPVAVVQCDQTREDLALAWRHLVGEQMRSYPIGGAHDRIMQGENAGKLARTLEEILDGRGDWRE